MIKKAKPKIIRGQPIKLKATQIHRSRKLYNRKKEKPKIKALVKESS